MGDVVSIERYKQRRAELDKMRCADCGVAFTLDSLTQWGGVLLCPACEQRTLDGGWWLVSGLRQPVA